MNRYIIKILKCRDEQSLKNKYHKIYKNGKDIAPHVTQRPIMYDSEYDAIDAAISCIEKEAVINFKLYIFGRFVCEITMDRLSFRRVKAQVKKLSPN